LADHISKRSYRPRERRVHQQPMSFKAPREIRQQVEWLAEVSGTSKGAAIKAAITAQYEQLTMTGGA